MNPDVQMTLEEAVDEVLNLVTGLDLSYAPEYDRFRSIVRHLNRALRRNALETEWSYYSSQEFVGVAQRGQSSVELRSSVRPRIISDDAVRLVHPATKKPVVWAYFQPRDAIYKLPNRAGLWVSYTKTTLQFSRAFGSHEHGLEIHVPVMRAPRKFEIPPARKNANDPIEAISDDVLQQLVDFEEPDLIVQYAAFLYAQSDPVMQPRVQTLEDQYKNLMYNLTERDQRNTDSPWQNEYTVPITSDIHDGGSLMGHGHPHADERWSNF